MTNRFSVSGRMQPDEQWEEPEPPQSGGLGPQWRDEWEPASAGNWAEESLESEIAVGGDARRQFLNCMSRMGYNLGTVVSICGLRGSPEHNGKQGKIVDFDHEAVRIRVLLDQELKTFSLKAVNLERLQGVVAQRHADRASASMGSSGCELARAGVGLVLKDVVRSGKNVLMVKSITEGSPAQGSGRIKIGDCLVSVDGRSVSTIYEASEAILG